MRKNISFLILSVLLLFCSSMNLTAFEYDGAIASYTTGTTEDIKKILVSTKGEASFSLSQPFDFRGNTLLRAAGFLSTRWYLNTTNFDTTADITLLSLSMTIPLEEKSTGSFEMGRFHTQDLTGLIFSQNIDGIRFIYDSPRLDINAFGGYTGFLNSRNNPMLPRKDSDTTGIYPFAQPLITADLSIYLPDLYEDKSFGFEGIYAINFNDTMHPSGYATVRIDGNFLYFIPYTLCSSFLWSSDSKNQSYMANLSFATMEYTIGSVHFGGKIQHASGNSGKIFKEFHTLSATYADKSDHYTYSNLLSVGIFGDYTHTNKVHLAWTSDTLMSLDDDTGSLIFGGQVFKLDVDIPIFGESKVSFDFGTYIPFLTGNFTSTLELCMKYGF